jgi:hypothetical protein
MTRLNITNKSIYKLKKNKNQSKKKVPKKRKYKKRNNRGTSFRKKRKKYNIKKNSIKNYNQKGGVLNVKQITNLRSVSNEIKNAPRVMTIVPFVKFNIDELQPNTDVEQIIKENKDSFGVKNLPFVINDNQDEPYARAIAQQDTKPNYNFNNYYLNETIKYKENEMPLFKMFIQRISRFIKYVNNNNKSQLQDQTNQIGDKIKELFKDNTKDKFRNYLEEKKTTLKFIQWLLDLTKNIDNADYDTEINETTIGGKTLRQLFYLYLDIADRKSITDLAAFITNANTAINAQDGDLDKLQRGVEIIKTAPPLNPCNSDNITATDDVKNYLKAAVAKINGVDLPPWENTDENIKEVFSSFNKEDETQINAKDASKDDKDSINSKKDEFQKSLQETTTSVNENLKKLEELKTRIKIIQEKNNEENKKIAELIKKKAENEEKIAENEKKTADAAVQKNDAVLLQKEEALSKAQEENDQTKAQLASLQEALAKCENDLKGESANKDELNKQKQENKAKIQELEEKLKEQEEQMEGLRKEKEEITSNGNNLRKNSDEAAQTLEEKTNELNNANNNMSEANNRGEEEEEEKEKEETVTNDALFGELETEIEDEDEPDDGGYFVHVYTDRAGKVRVNVVDGGQGESTQQWIKLAKKSE